MTLSERLHDPTQFIQFSEAQAAWALVRLEWPSLPAAVFESAPGVYPNASVYSDRLAHISFNGTQMASIDFWHEAGHVLEWQALIARYPDGQVWATEAPPAIFPLASNSVLQNYWTARGISDPLPNHLDGTWYNLAWEAFADTFMACNVLWGERTFVTAYPFDETAMTAFFKNLDGETTVKWISADTAFTTNSLGNGSVRVAVPAGALIAGRPTLAVPGRIGVAGTEATMPDFGANVAADLSYVDVFVRSDPVKNGTGYLRVALLQ